MHTATASGAPAFVRRYTLGANEYHTNFRKLDCETITRLTSVEATRVTSQMCKVYLSLVNAPARCWEREGVLRFGGEERDGGWLTAWEQLVSLVGVASATARKALRWMQEQGIVGYFAGKNGVGIRIFLNRAASSVGHKPQQQGQKNLRLVRASDEASHASPVDTPFNDSFAVSESLETDLNPRAPKNGAGQTEAVKNYLNPTHAPVRPLGHSPAVTENPAQQTVRRLEVPVGELVSRLRSELEPALQSAAKQAAAREHERTREWLESRGLPKAARVAQREAYGVLRRHGLIGTAGSRPALAAGAGWTADTVPPRALSPSEVRELAETCVAMLEVHGQPFDVTLAGLVAEAGGGLLSEDVPKVRALAEEMASGGRQGGQFGNRPG